MTRLKVLSVAMALVGIAEGILIIVLICVGSFPASTPGGGASPSPSASASVAYSATPSASARPTPSPTPSSSSTCTPTEQFLGQCTGASPTAPPVSSPSGPASSPSVHATGGGS